MLLLFLIGYAWDFAFRLVITILCCESVATRLTYCPNVLSACGVVKTDYSPGPTGGQPSSLQPLACDSVIQHSLLLLLLPPPPPVIHHPSAAAAPLLLVAAAPAAVPAIEPTCGLSSCSRAPPLHPAPSALSHQGAARTRPRSDRCRCAPIGRLLAVLLGVSMVGRGRSRLTLIIITSPPSASARTYKLQRPFNGPTPSTLHHAATPAHHTHSLSASVSSSISPRSISSCSVTVARSSRCVSWRSWRARCCGSRSVCGRLFGGRAEMVLVCGLNP